MLQVKDKVAFITGALGGIGQAYTRALLENGLRGVSLIDINDEHSESFQTELAKEFGPNKTIFIKTDLQKKSEIIGAFEKTVAHFKQLDIVVSTAGILKEESIEDTIITNLLAPMIVTDLALKTYLPKYQVETGAIVNTSSEAGLMPFELFPSYTVSKHGLVSMSSVYGTQGNFENYKVKLYTICPGATDTPMVNSAIENLAVKVPKENIQSPAALGNCLLEALKSGKNGSVWVVQSSVAKEFNYAALESIGAKFVLDLCPTKTIVSK